MIVDDEVKKLQTEVKDLKERVAKMEDVLHSAIQLLKFEARMKASGAKRS